MKNISFFEYYPKGSFLYRNKDYWKILFTVDIGEDKGLFTVRCGGNKRFCISYKFKLWEKAFSFFLEGNESSYITL